MIQELLKQECDLSFFHDNGYIRKQCPKCNDYYWTLDPNSTTCGDRPCVDYSFIGKTITPQKLTLAEVRNHFIDYFKSHDHNQVTYPETNHRCPVIARWRNDIYLTIASIADFQPHITSGVVPPPTNPLVISQPCIRLNDLENVGVSGRHLTMFEMMGHHAFNKNTDEIYWKEETVFYCDEYFTKRIGIPREAINYKEQLWIGGGNAGPCIEVLAGGLEIATLVFMNMKEDPRGDIDIEGVKYTQNPLNIVDTGYGLERVAWFTQGTPTIYDAILPETVDYIKSHLQETKDLRRIYALADHSKCLSFMLGDGIVPSNAKAGYLARLVIRRSLRFIDQLKLPLSLNDLVSHQLKLLEKEYPELIARQDEIHEALTLETQRFEETLTKGEGLVRRHIQEHNTITTDDLISLYDTHGMPPDVVKTIAAEEGISVSIPEDFNNMLADLHSKEKTTEEDREETEEIPCTHPLYYDDHYTKEFDATVTYSKPTPNGCLVALDKTAFYPEGGGQPADHGTLTKDGETYSVDDVQKHGNGILHHVKDATLYQGDAVHGQIDWKRRYILMKHHTGTHVVNAALKEKYGKHIWQAGSQLNTTDARFDFSHYNTISDEELKEIEHISNQLLQTNTEVKKLILDRNTAEKTYGFVLFQGGVPPGNMLRILDIPGIDVEACGGTHLNNTSEIEQIKILKVERIQDGVNRLSFAAGEMVDYYNQKEEETYQQLKDLLKEHYIITNNDEITTQLKNCAQLFSVPQEQLQKTLKRFLKETTLKGTQEYSSLPQACEHLFNEWKTQQKQKKSLSSDQLQTLKDQSQIIPETNLSVIIAEIPTEGVATAAALIKDGDTIVHLYDGKKLISAASDNVDIDLRKIAPQLGQILGGSGGGKPKMTQCGGPNKDNVSEALKKAYELTIEQITTT